jgi:hypothetical protein
VAFTPSSSIAPVTVTVAGTVAGLQPTFDRRPAVSGTVAVSNFPATQPVSGTVAVSNFPATQPVSGTVAVSGVAGTVLVDGSAVTQPVSVASLPLPSGASTEATLAAVNGAVQDVALTAILEREQIEAAA